MLTIAWNKKLKNKKMKTKSQKYKSQEMEKRVTQKIETYFVNYHENIRNYIETAGFKDCESVCALFQYLCDYPQLALDEDDFRPLLKYKRPILPGEQCQAQRPSGTQCTRRKKKGCEYCGTHQKKSQTSPPSTNHHNSYEIQEHQGICYHIDTNNNIYDPVDILNNVAQPRIIGIFKNNQVHLT